MDVVHLPTRYMVQWISVFILIRHVCVCVSPSQQFLVCRPLRAKDGLQSEINKLLCMHYLMIVTSPSEPHTDDMHVSMCTYVLICLHLNGIMDTVNPLLWKQLLVMSELKNADRTDGVSRV